jgi:membrane protease YdiL (CAAX protease family)
LNTVIIIPFLEEMLWRQCWSFMFPSIPTHLITAFAQDGSENHEKRCATSGYSTFAFTSSLFFSLSHVGNHIEAFDKLMTTSTDNSKICHEVLLPALHQVVQGFCQSLYLFSPLYVKHGVWACFGAHASNNLLASFNDRAQRILQVGHACLSWIWTLRSAVSPRAITGSHEPKDGVNNDSGIATLTKDGVL